MSNFIRRFWEDFAGTKEDTWRCEVCQAIRPDSRISVLTYPLRDAFAERNLKHCNDSVNCIIGAHERKASGRV